MTNSIKIVSRNFKKKLALLGLLFGLLFILTGCVVDMKNGQPTGQGWGYNLLVRPMSAFVDLFATNMGLGYGMGIILVTLIVRIIILPLGLRQAYKTTYMQEKMQYLKPVFEPINDRLKKARENRDQPGMMQAQQDLMKAQKDNGISMLSSIGCLPMLIQWPFFIALFYAARYTPGISGAVFHGINLGKQSLLLTVLAGALYLIQSWLATLGMSEEQKRTSRLMIFLSPLMIIFFSLSSPAGVVLYWVVGGVVMVVQQVIITFIMKPRMRKSIAAEIEMNPPKMQDLPKDVTDETAESEGLAALEADIDALETPDKDQDNKKTTGAGRNAGKQNKK